MSFRSSHLVPPRPTGGRLHRTGRIRITHLSRARGYWTARVHHRGFTYEVDRKRGWWEVVYPFDRLAVVTWVAEELERRVRAKETTA